MLQNFHEVLLRRNNAAVSNVMHLMEEDKEAYLSPCSGFDGLVAW